MKKTMSYGDWVDDEEMEESVKKTRFDIFIKKKSNPKLTFSDVTLKQKIIKINLG